MKFHRVQKERREECGWDPEPVDCSGILTMLAHLKSDGIILR
jgi:hypothetical protein